MLAHSLVTSPSADPDRYMLFLHGILGTRANWRGMARRFVAARPAWGAILVDLREHGESLGRLAPHSLSASAADLSELEQGLALPVRGVLGHSFGGKVALQWLRSRPEQPTEAWVIDASPSVQADDHRRSAAAKVLRTLETLPRRWPSREAFTQAVVDAGQPPPVAQWLAMNLRRGDDGDRVFGPSLAVIRDLMEDYARTDSWDVLEALPPQATLDLVIGGRSAALSRGDRSRLERLSKRNPRISMHIIEQAGHWVHVDAPDALFALLTSGPGSQR